MTVCLGALCADSSGNRAKAIVVASDRMVTLGGITEFEHGTPKIQTVTQHVVALTAGDALRGSRLVREVAASIPKDALTVQDIGSAIAQRYGHHRKEHIERDVFLQRNLSLAEFYRGGIQSQMLPQLVGQIDSYVSQYDFGVDLLVAGVDDGGAHLYSINNPGELFTDHFQIGYHAVGSGMLHALQSMIGFGHTSARGLYETIFAVYASKRRSEVAPGVGQDTDMMLITPKGIINVSSDILKELEELYVADYLQPVKEETIKKLSKIKFLEEEKNETN